SLFCGASGCCVGNRSPLPAIVTRYVVAGVVAQGSALPSKGPPDGSGLSSDPGRRTLYPERVRGPTCRPGGRRSGEPSARGCRSPASRAALRSYVVSLQGGALRYDDCKSEPARLCPGLTPT